MTTRIQIALAVAALVVIAAVPFLFVSPAKAGYNCTSQTINGITYTRCY